MFKKFQSCSRKILSKPFFQKDIKRKNTVSGNPYQLESRLDKINNITMSTTNFSTVNDQDLFSVGLVESASVNSINDFTQSNLIVTKENVEEDFVNTFICHMIFYGIFCFSLALHIVIDFGLGSFIKKIYIQLIGLKEKTSLEETLSFA